ncbi:MAG: hypothetical protein H0V17_34680 [Deltaproteobacteria bacterium]|nr:hypothetical protein [Deltaproteobacteria bacterium]
MVRWLLVIALVACKGPLDNERAQLDDSARLGADARLSKLAATTREHAKRVTGIVLKRAQALAAIPELTAALLTEGSERQSKARVGFMKFIVAGTDKPDALALVDINGDVIAMHDTPAPIPKMWRAETPGAKTRFPALDFVLASTTSISDTILYSDAPLRIGAATLVDAGRPIGAVVTLYAMNASMAARDKSTVGADVGYVTGTKALVTTLGEHATWAQLSDWLATKPASSAAFAAGTGSEASRYVVRTVEIPRAAATEVPASYPPSPISMLVFEKVTGILEP